MKFKKFKQTLAISAIALTLFASCSDDNDDPNPTPTPEVKNDFHIAFASGSGSASATYVQGISDLSKGTITSRTGYQLESSRTARIFVSEDGTNLYSLNYTIGTIEKLSYHGSDEYNRVSRYDASIPLGATAIRFTKLNDDEASVHYITATAQYDENNVYQGHKMLASIGIIDLENLKIKTGYKTDIEVKIDENLAKSGYYISRIDSPVLSEGKLYYGAALNKFDPSTGKNTTTDKTFTLIVNYSDLSDASIISTDKVSGSTNGYRTPTQHKNEAGEIFQMVSGNDEVHIVKIKDGKYDESFDYNLSKLLNKPADSNGWFYAGNGIGYIPYEDLTTPSKVVGVDPNGKETKSCMWKLAKMDLNKGTVVDLNVPDDLWLTQYQTSVVRDGIFYIALSPIGKDGHIYMFNVNSDSKDATLGASITGTGVDQYYIGIY